MLTILQSSWRPLLAIAFVVGLLVNWLAPPPGAGQGLSRAWTPGCPQQPIRWQTRPNTSFSIALPSSLLTSTGPIDIEPGRHGGNSYLVRTDAAGVQRQLDLAGQSTPPDCVEIGSSVWIAVQEIPLSRIALIEFDRDSLSIEGRWEYENGPARAKGKSTNAIVPVTVVAFANGEIGIIHSGRPPTPGALPPLWLVRFDRATGQFSSPLSLAQTSTFGAHGRVLLDGSVGLFQGSSRYPLLHFNGLTGQTLPSAPLPAPQLDPRDPNAKLLGSSGGAFWSLGTANATVEPPIALEAVLAHPAIGQGHYRGVPFWANPVSLRLRLLSLVEHRDSSAIVRDETVVKEVVLQAPGSQFATPLGGDMSDTVRTTFSPNLADGLFLFALDGKRDILFQLITPTPAAINNRAGVIRFALLDSASTSIHWLGWLSMPKLDPRSLSRVELQVIPRANAWMLYLMQTRAPSGGHMIGGTPLAWAATPNPSGIAMADGVPLSGYVSPRRD